MFRIKSPQDFGAAVLFIAFGVAGIWFGTGYEVGFARDMGPGYFPMVLSWGLILFGLVIGSQAVLLPGPRFEPVVWRAVLLVLGAIVAFGLLIESAGLAIATFAVTVLSALASTESRWKESIALGAALALFGVLVFIYGLHQSMTVFGMD